MISIVSPIYNEENNIVELYERIKAALGGINEKFELILVENGSTDRSLEIIKSIRMNDTRVKFVSLSKNFGHQGAIIAGYAHSSGDAVISLDGDLQQPPELIPQMVALWKKGCDVVYTTKKPVKKDGTRYMFLTRIFYKLAGLISDVNINYGQSDYRLLTRRVMDVLMQIPEKHKFLRGMVEWVGFSQAGIEYEVDARRSGESKFSFWNYISFALDGIFSFSVFPLRLFLVVGLIIAAFCGFFAFYYFVMGVMTLIAPKSNLLPSGSATITVGIFFLGGVQLIGIGCLGEYLARVYTQTKARPDFIVKEKGV